MIMAKIVREFLCHMCGSDLAAFQARVKSGLDPIFDLRKEQPFENQTSPSAVPVYGLSDQTATVERNTVGRSRDPVTKRL